MEIKNIKEIVKTCCGEYQDIFNNKKYCNIIPPKEIEMICLFQSDHYVNVKDKKYLGCVYGKVK